MSMFRCHAWCALIVEPRVTCGCKGHLRAGISCHEEPCGPFEWSRRQVPSQSSLELWPKVCLSWQDCFLCNSQMVSCRIRKRGTQSNWSSRVYVTWNALLGKASLFRFGSVLWVCTRTWNLQGPSKRFWWRKILRLLRKTFQWHQVDLQYVQAIQRMKIFFCRIYAWCCQFQKCMKKLCLR